VPEDLGDIVPRWCLVLLAACLNPAVIQSRSRPTWRPHRNRSGPTPPRRDQPGQAV